VLVTLCVPDEAGVAGERLLRPQFGMYRIAWPDELELAFRRARVVAPGDAAGVVVLHIDAQAPGREGDDEQVSREEEPVAEAAPPAEETKPEEVPAE